MGLTRLRLCSLGLQGFRDFAFIVRRHHSVSLLGSLVLHASGKEEIKSMKFLPRIFVSGN
jgi:hypothetical protein